MDATIEYLWQRQNGRLVSAADWAIKLLEAGNDSSAVCRLTDRHLPEQVRDRLILEIVEELGRSDLLNPSTLIREYERESIGDYFAGRMDGWTLIIRCCDLSYSRFNDDPSNLFWVRLAEDAGHHGGQGICLVFDFLNNDFDETLRAAILQSDRPLPPDLL